MKHYLINAHRQIADQYIVFYELLSEDEYRVYMYAKLKLKYLNRYLPDISRGINLLSFEPIEISDIEYQIISKYLPDVGECIMDDITDMLVENYEDKYSTDIDKITPENLIKCIDGLSNIF